MLKKEIVLKLVKELPNQFELNELVDKLIALEKRQIGLQHVEDENCFKFKRD